MSLMCIVLEERGPGPHTRPFPKEADGCSLMDVSDRRCTEGGEGMLLEERGGI